MRRHNPARGARALEQRVVPPWQLFQGPLRPTDPPPALAPPCPLPPPSIWWQFIPYFLLGMSEVFTNVGVMELFYTQVG